MLDHMIAYLRATLERRAPRRITLAEPSSTGCTTTSA